jgi:hypothetical protein
MYFVGKALIFKSKANCNSFLLFRDDAKPTNGADVFILLTSDCSGGKKSDRMECLLMLVFLGCFSLQFKVDRFISV